MKQTLFSIGKRMLSCVLLLCCLNTIQGQQTYDKKIVAGFYPYMKDYILKPENVQVDKLTHLVYAFAYPSTDGNISTESGSYHTNAAILVQRLHAQGKKFICLMGGGSQSGGYQAMAASPTARANFINNMVNWMKTYGYDGINIDWEYPGATGVAADKQNLNALVQETRAAFDVAGAQLGKHLEISIDCHSSLYYAQWVDFAFLKNYIDWFGLMAYDYAGNWSYCIHAAHNAPLYCGPAEICDRYLCVDRGMKNLRDSLAIPASKIVMGIPFYGAEFQNSALYQTPREGGGALPYYDIKPQIGSTYTRYWDSQSLVPYLLKTSGNGVITYDDEESIGIKCDYIKQNNLLGAMIWEITQDVDKITKEQPLLKAVADKLIDVVNDNKGIPTVSITSPANGFIFTPGSNLSIKANASVDASSSITKVEFYKDNLLLGTDNTSPYEYIWNSIPNGKYTLKAIAYSAAGKSTESAKVSITDGLVPEAVEMFDDFNYLSSDDPALAVINKWYVVNGIDGPPSGANYSKNNITFFADPNNADNKLMGVATTANNNQTNNTHARIETSEMVYRNGTFAARVYFDDTPAQYGDGNVETFYTINSYATCNQAEKYSEVDFEYLPWDSWHWERKNTMYMTTWETCEIRTHEKSVKSWAGWHDLVYTYIPGEPVKWYIDGVLIASIDAGHTPDSDQNISFANWIYQNTVGGDPTTRTTKMMVDWVYHAKDVVFSSNDVLQKVANFKTKRITRKNLAGEAVTDGIAPVVQITQPASNANFVNGQTITIAATATDADGSVSKIEFYANGTKIGEKIGASGSIQWTIPNAGSFTLTAKATDNMNIPGTSAPVYITVDEVVVPRPEVNITAPANNAVFQFQSNVTITANATDATGTVTKVEFFINGQSVLVDNAAPYQYVLNSAQAGQYTVYAIATNNLNNTKQSASVAFTVSEAPSPVVSITSPANQSLVAVGSNVTIQSNPTTSMGTITKVEFYVNNTLLTTVTQSPFNATISNIAQGKFDLKVKAFNSYNKSTESSAVTIIARSAYAQNTIPGTIETENYDKGGEGIAYHDATTGNTGGAYRTDDVDIEACSAGGYNVGYTANGEWMEFTVNVAAAGNYDITFYTAAVDGYNGTLTLDFNGVNKGGTVQIPATGGWQTWKTVKITNVALSAGVQNMRLTLPTAQYNIDKIVFANSGNTPIPPVCSITAPANNASFVKGSNVAITASASDPDGSIKRVEFYNGSQLLGSVTASPYTFTMSNVQTGTYTITAKAVDNADLTTTSSAITFTVVESIKYPPVCIVTSPANGASFTTGANIAINATATDQDGTISRVEFYNGTTLISSDNSSPYAATISNAAAGTYNLTAKAIDNDNLSGTSSVVTIIVKAPVAPTVSITSPTNNSTINSGQNVVINASASDADGSVAKVQFYKNSITAANLLSEDATSPYQHTLTTPAIGRYVIIAQAVDNSGMTASATVNFTVANVVVNIEVIYTTIVSWGTGFQGQVTVINRGTVPVSNWVVEFDCGNNIAPIWDAQIVSHTGNHYVIQGTTATNTIPANSQVIFGFIGNVGQGQTLSLPTNVKGSVSGTKDAVISESTELANDVELLQNIPNPFNGQTNIQFVLNKNSRVELSIIAMDGKRVATLYNQQLKAGKYSTVWNGNATPGVYILQLRTGNNVITRQLLKTK